MKIILSLIFSFSFCITHAQPTALLLLQNMDCKNLDCADTFAQSHGFYLDHKTDVGGTTQYFFIQDDPAKTTKGPINSLTFYFENDKITAVIYSLGSTTDYNRLLLDFMSLGYTIDQKDVLGTYTNSAYSSPTIAYSLNVAQGVEEFNGKEYPAYSFGIFR